MNASAELVSQISFVKSGLQNRGVYRHSIRFYLIFRFVLIPLLIREFTYPHLLTPMTLRAREFIRSKGASFMSQLLTRFWKDQSGATAIEYGLIAAGISVAIIAAVNGIGTKLNTSFGSISTQLK
jgi:pilus assembly protein Flp/PilA